MPSFEVASNVVAIFITLCMDLSAVPFCSGTPGADKLCFI